MVQEGAPNLAEKRHLHPELLPTSTSTSMGTMGLEGERGVGIGRTEAFQAGAEPGEVAEAIGTPGQATTGATGAMRATGAKEAITPSPSVRGGEVGPAVGGPETPIAGQQVSGSSASGSAMATRTPVTAESSIPSQAAPVSTGTATTTREPPILGTASEPKMHPTRNEPAEWSSDETRLVSDHISSHLVI